MFDGYICYRKQLGFMKIFQIFQRNNKLPLPWQKQVSHPLITVNDLYGVSSLPCHAQKLLKISTLYMGDLPLLRVGVLT